MSAKIFVYEKGQEQHTCFIKRRDALLLESHAVARFEARTELRLLITLKPGIKDPVKDLIKRYRKIDRGNLLPPLEYYPPFNYPLPAWLLRSYQ